MAKRKQINEEDYMPAEVPLLVQAEVLLKKMGKKYRPIPKFKDGCKNC